AEQRLSRAGAIARGRGGPDEAGWIDICRNDQKKHMAVGSTRVMALAARDNEVARQMWAPSKESRTAPIRNPKQLTGNPMSARACGHVQPQKLAARMMQDQKSIQQPKRDRRDYENPSMQCRRHDCAQRSSSPATVAAFSSPCTLPP